MLEGSEVIVALLGAGVLVFIIANRPRLRRLPAWKVLIAGFLALLTGWTLAILEDFSAERFWNVSEHLCYALSCALVAAWCWSVFTSGKERSREVRGRH